MQLAGSSLRDVGQLLGSVQLQFRQNRPLVCAEVAAASEIAAVQPLGSKADPLHDKIPAAKPQAQMEHVEEAKRLLQERSSLLKTGSYSKESNVIQQLDAKIQELGNKALGTWAPSS